jgi:hypothetical protein
MKAIKIEALPGYHINEVCENAVRKARELQCVVEFEFNEIIVIVSPSDTAEGAAQRFMAECQRRRDEYEKSPAGIESARRTADAQKKADEAAAEGIKPFSIKHGAESEWEKCVKNNSDPYGACTVRYAARWAHLMEKRMEAGEKIATIADQSSHDADLEGITGFMYGCAVSILAHAWKHGEALRLWHNLKTQIGKEGEKANETGGVLNPALLNIGG